MDVNKMSSGQKQPLKAESDGQNVMALGFYLDTDKFVRDLVHGYVYLTKFELKLIDTIEFQRLKDIRQLTCQHVYPAAKHTRFEHSLGVLELTRQAIKNLNRNGIITTKEKELFCDNLRFNAELAALLHDVGHCPFSHLGEIEFDKNEVWERLNDEVQTKLSGSALAENFEELTKNKGKKPGAVHEQLSCVMILAKFYDELVQVQKDTENKLGVDFELLVHSILGIDYDVSAELLETREKEYRENQKKNVIVHLINSRVFDMDKLDYIMRDSCMTGIGTPMIDTHRLFRNMYLNEQYALVFTSRAVSTLQNMIEARDGLYMYVYNHHAVVFSDFMYTYILRRLDHNSRDFQKLLGAPASNLEVGPITELGILPKNYLFSLKAVIDKNRSDSDLISQLNDIYHALQDKYCSVLDETVLENVLAERIKEKSGNGEMLIEGSQKPLLDNMYRVYMLIERHLNRDYLKPWWKTYSEFSNFIERNFLSDKVRGQLCDWICNRKDDRPAGDEFRSQLAKHVNAITNKLFEEDTDKICGLCKPLGDGEFFVIQRSSRFFDPETIRELDIAQKINTILGSQGDVKYSTSEYYVKELTNIIPQRDYYSLYAKNSFYIFSKPLDAKEYSSPSERKRHYQMIEQIFVFVATTLIERGAEDFWVRFEKEMTKEKRAEKEKDSQDKMYDLFAKRIGLRKKKKKG